MAHQSEVLRQLKQRREELSITQEHLADIAGVGLRTVKEIEVGKGNPTLDTLLKVADVLGMQLKLEIKKL